MYCKYTPSFVWSGPSQVPPCVSCLKSKQIFPPQEASTGTVVAVLGILAPLPNHKCTPPWGFVPQGPPTVYPLVTDCHNPLNVPPEKSSEEAPPTPTCCNNMLSPQAIESRTATILVLHWALVVFVLVKNK